MKQEPLDGGQAYCPTFQGPFHQPVPPAAVAAVAVIWCHSDQTRANRRMLSTEPPVPASADASEFLVPYCARPRRTAPQGCRIQPLASDMIGHVIGGDETTLAAGILARFVAVTHGT